MNWNLKYTLILLIILATVRISAQNSHVLYFMNLPQNHLLNPALRPSNSLYIGLPGISGINLNINNNFVNFSDVFMKGGSSDSLITFLHPKYNIDDFLSKIKDKNSFEPQLSVQLFGLGFSIGKSSYVFLDVNDRVEGNVVIPGDLIKLAFKGNESFVGNSIDLSSLRGDIKYYREVGLGFSKDFTSKLRIGIRGKLLLGIATASIRNKSLGISVNNDYTHTINADVAVNFSAPLDVEMDSKGNVQGISFDDNRYKESNEMVNFLTGMGNKGLGLDLGATYNITERLIVSASVTDFGFIKWKKDLTNLTSNNQFVFSGLNMTDVLDGSKTIDEVGQEMVDSLKASFKISESSDPFTTYLPCGITLAGRYNLTKSISVGLLSYSRVIGKQVRESLTLSANVNLGNSFSTSLSYTAENHRFDNFGAGIAFRPGIFQFYLLTDRIPITWNKIKTDNDMTVLPASWNNISLRLGMNLAFGNRIKKKNDKPMLIVE